MEQNQTQDKQVNLADLTASECLNLLWTALNKANTAGAFQLDEAYVLKVAHNNVKNKLRELEESKTNNA